MEYNRDESLLLHHQTMFFKMLEIVLLIIYWVISSNLFCCHYVIPFSMNRTQFGYTVPHLSREEKEEQQLCQKPLLCRLIALSGRELCNILQNNYVPYALYYLSTQFVGNSDKRKM